MKRREFITLLGGAAAAWPLAARAQQPERMRRDRRADRPRRGRSGNEVAACSISAAACTTRMVGGPQCPHRHSLGRGQTQSASTARERALALQPDVILAHATRMLPQRCSRKTRTIPIVFVTVSDPIGSGFVASLARPGGNLTGMLSTRPSIAGKWLAMLKEIAPRLTRAALVANPKTTPLWLLPAGGQGRGAVAGDRACAQSRRDGRRHRARHR